MAKPMGYISQQTLDKVRAAHGAGAKVGFTGNTHQTETILFPVYLDAPANDNLEAQKKLTAMLVAQQQLKKLYVELTNSDAVGEQWEDGEYSHKGYVITNAQLERLGELVGYTGGKK